MTSNPIIETMTGWHVYVLSRITMQEIDSNMINNTAASDPIVKETTGIKHRHGFYFKRNILLFRGMHIVVAFFSCC